MTEQAIVERLDALQGGLAALSQLMTRIARGVLAGELKYSIPEAARRLRVSERTLHRRLSDGLVNPVREGGRTFITEEECRRSEEQLRRGGR